MARPDENSHIFDLTDPSVASHYSSVFSLSRGSMFSLFIKNTGLTGTITLWVTNNPDYDAAEVEWVEETGVTFTALAGAASEFINAGNAAGRFYKLKYVHSSGTGDLDVYTNHGEA